MSLGVLLAVALVLAVLQQAMVQFGLAAVNQQVSLEGHQLDVLFAAFWAGELI